MKWQTVRLGKIAIQDRVIVSPDSPEIKLLPYLGLDQIESQTGRILAYESKSAEGKSTAFAFDTSHVLYGKLRPYLNKVAVPEQKGRCSTEIIPLKPNGVDRDFLGFLLRRNEIVEAAMSEKTGSRMPRADMDALLSFEITIPDSIEDQRRIAARLKAQLAEVEKARQAAEAQLRDAAFLAARHQESTLDQLENVPRATLSELLLGIEAGKSFQTLELPARPDELGVLKVSAVSWNNFQPQEAKVVESDYQPEDRHRIKQGDLIISRANTRELVGAVVRVYADYPLRLLSDKTLRLIVDEEQVLPDYLLNILKWPEARAHIEHNATGTSDSMRNISQKTINTIPIPLISKDRQQTIVERFQSIAEEVQQIETATKQAISDFAFLPPILLSQAFES